MTYAEIGYALNTGRIIVVNMNGRKYYYCADSLGKIQESYNGSEWFYINETIQTLSRCFAGARGVEVDE